MARRVMAPHRTGRPLPQGNISGTDRVLFATARPIENGTQETRNDKR